MHAMAWRTATLYSILQQLGMLAISSPHAHSEPIMHFRLCHETLLHATRHECSPGAGHGTPAFGSKDQSRQWWQTQN